MLLGRLESFEESYMYVRYFSVNTALRKYRGPPAVLLEILWPTVAPEFEPDADRGEFFFRDILSDKKRGEYNDFGQKFKLEKIIVKWLLKIGRVFFLTKM